MSESQKIAILKRLERGDTITGLDALNDPDIRTMKLATRISELISQGHKIDKIDVETPSGKRIKAYKIHRPMDGDQSVFGF